jgi:hypothetical protein
LRLSRVRYGAVYSPIPTTAVIAVEIALPIATFFLFIEPKKF